MARKTKKLKTRESFYIITNGKETEKNYFNLIKSFKSIYDVKVEFKNLDPLRLVEYAQVKISGANQVWCVFDIDSFHKEGKIEQAVVEARRNGIRIAYSNIAFEVWLINHFKRCMNEKSATEVNESLSKYLKKLTGNKDFEYEKSDGTILKKYFMNNIDQAINNSKIIYETFVKEHNQQYGATIIYPIWNWNPSTNVYMLIEALKLTELNKN